MTKTKLMITLSILLIILSCKERRNDPYKELYGIRAELDKIYKRCNAL